MPPLREPDRIHHIVEAGPVPALGAPWRMGKGRPQVPPLREPDRVHHIVGAGPVPALGVPWRMGKGRPQVPPLRWLPAMQSRRTLRKRIRLPHDAYQTHGSVWHVTIGSHDRSTSLIANNDGAIAICTAFEDRASARQTELLLFCLMPDHAHLLVQVDQTPLIEAIADLKSGTTRVWWSFGGSGKLWQRSFHDHGIRGPDDLEATVAYLFANPVNAGLVSTWEEYPFIGGTLVSPG